MECREAESLVQQYIDDKLSPKKLEAFISHVNQCPACYEELEIHYIIHHAVKYLDEDRHDSYNMKEMLTKDLQKKKRQLDIRRKMKFAAIYIGIVLTILLAVFIVLLLSHDTSLTGMFGNLV